MKPKRPSRFRVVEGDGERPAVVGKTPSGKRATLEIWRCSKCTDETGDIQSDMIRIRHLAFIDNGKLYAGEEWWCCARCHNQVALIKRFPIRRRQYED